MRREKTRPAKLRGLTVRPRCWCESRWCRHGPCRASCNRQNIIFGSSWIKAAVPAAALQTYNMVYGQACLLCRRATRSAPQRLRLRGHKFPTGRFPGAAREETFILVGLLSPGRSLPLLRFDVGQDLSDFMRPSASSKNDADRDRSRSQPRRQCAVGLDQAAQSHSGCRPADVLILPAPRSSA